MTANSLSIPKLESTLDSLLRDRRFDEALNLTHRIVNYLSRRKDFRGRYVHLKSLDDFIGRLSLRLVELKLIRPEEWLTSDYDPFSNGRRGLIVGSEFYLNGGHTRLAERLNYENNFECDVLLTDPYGTYKKNPAHLEALKKSFKFHSFQVLQSTTFLQKISELDGFMTNSKPSKVYLLAHHEDVIAYTTLAASHLSVDFIHHCDHTPTLGATLAAFNHIDLTSELKVLCRSFLSNPPSFRPILTLDRGYILKRKHENFNTVSCGSPHKFSGNPQISYGDLLVKALQITNGTHYHIGPITEELRSDIVSAFQRSGTNLDRVKNITWVRSLAETLTTLDVDCLIASFPEGGATTAIEAQSTATPVVYYYDPQVQPIFLAINSIYANKDLGWSSIEGFEDAMRVCVENVEFYSREARRFYDRYKNS